MIDCLCQDEHAARTLRVLQRHMALLRRTLRGRLRALRSRCREPAGLDRQRGRAGADRGGEAVCPVRALPAVAGAGERYRSAANEPIENRAVRSPFLNFWEASLNAATTRPALRCRAIEREDRGRLHGASRPISNCSRWTVAAYTARIIKLIRQPL